MNTKCSIFTSADSHEWKYKFCGVHELNEIQYYTEKNQIFCFIYALIYND